MKFQLNVKNESKEVNLLVNLMKKYEEKINKNVYIYYSLRHSKKMN